MQWSVCVCERRERCYCSLNRRSSSSTSSNFVFRSLRSHRTCRSSSMENRGWLASNVVNSWNELYILMMTIISEIDSFYLLLMMLDWVDHPSHDLWYDEWNILFLSTELRDRIFPPLIVDFDWLRMYSFVGVYNLLCKHVQVDLESMEEMIMHGNIRLFDDDSLLRDRNSSVLILFLWI